MILFNAALIVVPVAGVAIVYRNNLSALVVTPQVERITNGTFFTEVSFELPKLVNAGFDVSSQTVILIFNFTNPFNYRLTIKSISADAESAKDNFTLGHAILSSPVFLNPNETSDFIIAFTLTSDALRYILANYVGVRSIDIELVDVLINVDDIMVQPNEPIFIPNVPIA